MVIEPNIIDSQMLDEGLPIESGAHVIRLNLVTDPSALFALEKLFKCCATFKIHLACLLRRRVHLLRDDSDFIKARREIDKLRKSKSESDVKTERITELNDMIKDLARGYRLDSQAVSLETKNLRKKETYKYHVNSQIAQKIFESLLVGIDKVLQGEAKDLHIPLRNEFDAVVAKQDGSGLVLDLLGGHVAVSFRGTIRKKTAFEVDKVKHTKYCKKRGKVTIEAIAPRTSDAMDEIETLRKLVSKYKYSGLSNGHNPVRYCAIRRRLYNDHGHMAYRYELLIVVAGKAPKRKGMRQLGKGKAGMDASTFAHTFVTVDKAKIIVPSPALNKLADKLAAKQRRMDEILRAKNPDWFDKDGQFKRPKDKAIRDKGLIKDKEYFQVKWKYRMLWQRYCDTRRAEFNRVANQLVGEAEVFIMEDMNYKALQKRGHHEVEVEHKQEDGTVETTTENQSFTRFGRSLLKAAPGLFFAILEAKVLAAGGQFIRVNPADIKASQYNPLTMEYIKHELNDRVIEVAEGLFLQRDLLSAYILMNCVKVKEDEPQKEPKAKKTTAANETKDASRKRERTKEPRRSRKRVKYEIDKKACLKGFARFVEHSVYEIALAVLLGKKMPPSVGLEDFAKLYENN